MRRRTTISSCVVLMLLGMAVVAAAQTPGNKTNNKPIPPFSEVKQAVLRYFQAKSDYQPGDMLTRDQVEPLLGKIVQMGLPLPDAKKLLDLVPSKDSFLAQQFATPQGRQFMRQIAKYPNAYDRVDRLSRLPRGEQTVRDLIKGPDGDKMIEYMTTSKGGNALGGMLSNAPLGTDFNEPTGRIYTADMLLAKLEAIHAAAVGRPAK